MFNAKIDTKQQFITALKEQSDELNALLDAQTQLANKHRVEVLELAKKLEVSASQLKVH